MGVLLSILLTVIINNNLCCHFKVAYKQDTIYSKIIKDLTMLLLAIGKSFAILTIRKHYKDIVLALKPGHPFCLANYLLYNQDNNGKEHLVIPFLLIKKILAKAYNN